MVRNVVVLGSTGSIGRQALEVIEANPDRFRVVGLAAGGSHLELLAEQVQRFQPALVGLPVEPSAAADARALDVLKQRPVVMGPGANEALAAMDEAGVVLNAITGAAGLLATLAALKAGKTLALANKESLVIGGTLVTEAAAPGQLVAVDSEHSAIAQALRSGRVGEARKVILTASGGPFRGLTRAQLADVTPEQAMHHPTWNMGRVITINSATLVNKGLELLEASLLYGVALDDIEVVVHPQSVVHSGVEFNDGATILQASPPDMKLPIGLALAWPERLAGVARPCDWRAGATWTFEPLDEEAFPAVNLARRAGLAGGTAPAVFNAANEVAVDAFCAGEIGFLRITDVIAAVLDEHLTHSSVSSLTVDAVMGADAWARQAGHRLVSRLQ
ncbi:MAG: 1-deoxy-D-xylulose-5-phosphate reductoisomerase [Propionibacteriaceae bacterium]|nr:1-deoxy-D-xylulose-5-phosphate reductoisomerase [Propionibacteriaceae bacterium]